MNNRNPVKGRGTQNRIDPRFLSEERQAIDDGWQHSLADPSAPRTTVTVEHCKSILTHNQSPDIPFTTSINPYRGCEHGCIYCYARPGHAYMDLSPGVDFESKLFAKPDAAKLLAREISKPGYQCSPIALGSNTDPYQPIERDWQITRQIITVLHKYKHPLTIVTKSRLVERDIDLLTEMAAMNLVQVFVSVTTLDNDLYQRLEPRATAPEARLQTLTKLNKAGIPTGVMFAPVIPVLNDMEMESVLAAAASTGINNAGYVMLRLPHEVKTIFREWLEIHYPLKADHVMSMVRDIRGGRENDPEFKSRMRGKGIYADMIADRFRYTCRRLQINTSNCKLDCNLFSRPVQTGDQLNLL